MWLERVKRAFKLNTQPRRLMKLHYWLGESLSHSQSLAFIDLAPAVVVQPRIKVDFETETD